MVDVVVVDRSPGKVEDVLVTLLAQRIEKLVEKGLSPPFFLLIGREKGGQARIAAGQINRAGGVGRQVQQVEDPVEHRLGGLIEDGVAEADQDGPERVFVAIGIAVDEEGDLPA